MVKTFGYAVGKISNQLNVLLKYSNNKIEKVIEDDQHLSLRNDTMISGIITSIWTNDKKLFVLTTQSIFRNSISFYSKPNAFWKYHPSFWGSRRLRGNFSNDLFTSGAFSRFGIIMGIDGKPLIICLI